MEKCLEKIKNEIELKRKHNEETLRLLKQKSILYNAQKEKQKNFFLNRTSTFLGKKRKLSNDSDDIKNNDNEISNDLNNYADYDEYIDDFMNSSFMSTRTFTNLNFCRPERFSYKNKKKKLLIKSEEKFTINKTIKPKEIKKSEISGFTLTNNIKKNNNIQSGFTSDFMNKSIANENKTEDLFDIKDKDNNKKTGGLFSSDSIYISDNNISSNNSKDNINTKSLFTSNMKDEDKKEEKEIGKNDNKDSNNEEKKGLGLFGDINRIKDNEENKPVLFGTKENKSPEKKQKIPEKVENSQKTSLFNFGANDKDNEKEEKNKNNEIKSLFSSTSSNNLFGEQFKTQEKKAESNKDDIKKESENKEVAKSLFGEGLFKFSEKKEEKNEEKEKLNLSNIKELKEKEDKKESEKKSEPKEKISLFGNITEISKEKSEKPFSLFGNVQTGSNINSNAEQEKKAELPILNEKKDVDEQKPNFGIFNSVNSDNKTSSIFNSNENISPLGAKNDEEKNKNNIKENNPINANNNEDKNLKDIINNGKGTLVNNNNPFLNPEKHNPLPNYFSAKNLTPKKVNDSNNTNASIFNSVPNTNNSIFNTNNQNKPFFFEANATSTNRMDMSPQQKGRNLFTNNPPANNSLFGTGNSGNSQFNNIFNNSNSLFNNNNSGFAGGSGSLFTNQNNGFFSNLGNNNGFSLGFSMGKK